MSWESFYSIDETLEIIKEENVGVYRRTDLLHAVANKELKMSVVYKGFAVEYDYEEDGVHSVYGNPLPFIEENLKYLYLKLFHVSHEYAQHWVSPIFGQKKDGVPPRLRFLYPSDPLAPVLCPIYKEHDEWQMWPRLQMDDIVFEKKQIEEFVLSRKEQQGDVRKSNVEGGATKERRNLLRIIGGLCLVVSETAPKYKKGKNVNKSAIYNKMMEVLDAEGLETKGLSQSSLSDKIGEAIAVLREERF